MHIRKFEDMVRVLEEMQGGEADDAKARKRRRIIEVATELFIRHGYRKTSIDDVADKAGIAKGTVYLYFKTKSELLVQAILDEKLRYVGAMRPIFDQSVPARERLRRFISIAFRMAAEMPLTASLLSGDRELAVALQEMAQIDPEQARSSLAIQIEFVADLLAAADGRRTPTDDQRARGQVVLDLLTALMIFGRRGDRNAPDPRFGDRLADMLIDGLAPPATALPAASKSKSRSKSTSRR
jgi:AcrR family transcriptional regulator